MCYLNSASVLVCKVPWYLVWRGKEWHIGVGVFFPDFRWNFKEIEIQTNFLSFIPWKQVKHVFHIHPSESYSPRKYMIQIVISTTALYLKNKEIFLHNLLLCLRLIWDIFSFANRAEWCLKTELLISFVIDFIHLGYYYRTRYNGSMHFRLFHPIIFHYNEKRKLCDGLTMAFQ